MILVCNGLEGATLQGLKGSDQTLNLLVLDDNGQPISCASPAVLTLEFYPSNTRGSTVALTVNPTISANAAGGYSQYLVDDLTTLPRGQYYLSAVWKSNSGTGSGTTIKISRTMTVFTLG